MPLYRPVCCISRIAFSKGIFGLYLLMRSLQSFPAFHRKTTSCFRTISSNVLTLTAIYLFYLLLIFLEREISKWNCLISSEQLLVLIEYVPFGDLLGYLRKSRGLKDTYYKDPDIKPQTNLTSQQLMKFAWQIADGMSYLSSKSVS